MQLWLLTPLFLTTMISSLTNTPIIICTCSNFYISGTSIYALVHIPTSISLPLPTLTMKLWFHHHQQAIIFALQCSYDLDNVVMYFLLCFSPHKISFVHPISCIHFLLPNHFLHHASCAQFFNFKLFHTFFIHSQMITHTYISSSFALKTLFTYFYFARNLVTFICT